MRFALESPNEAMKTSSFSRRMATLRKGSSRRIDPDSDGTNSFAFCRIWRRIRSRSMSLLRESPAFCRSRKRSSCGISSAWNCIVRIFAKWRLYGLLIFRCECLGFERDGAIRGVMRHPTAPVPQVFRDVPPEKAHHTELPRLLHMHELMAQKGVAGMFRGNVNAAPEGDGDGVS